MKYTEQELNVINKYYFNGGVKKVQEFINRSPDSIRHKAKELGLTRIDGFRTNQADINDYLNIQSEKIAYILGWIWGDGTIYCDNRHFSVSISIQEGDGLEIKNIFDERWKVYFKKKQKETWKNQITFNFNHKKLVSFLISNDYKIKSQGSPCKILNKVPDNLKSHFFRGWFDADGYIGKSNMGISGAKNQDWSALIKICEALNIDFKISKNISKSGTGEFFNMNKKESKIFLDFIYYQSNFKLDRKYQKYLNVFK